VNKTVLEKNLHMNNKQWISVGVVLVRAVFLKACVTTHPHEKLVIGEWKPVKVEKFFTPEEEEQMKNAQSQAAKSRPSAEPEQPSEATGNTSLSSPSQKPTDQGRVGESAVRDPEAELNKRIQVESRSNMILYNDLTLEKFYREKTFEGTWKLKRKGSVLAVRIPERRETYRVDVLDVSDDTLVLVGNLPVGGIKITYKKIGDGLKDELIK
jgi:hypothetical protein